MKSQLKKYIPYISSPKFMASVGVGILLLVTGIIINFYAGTYAAARASNSVSDIILDNIRVYNVDEIFVYGPLFLWIFVAFLCLKEPKRIPFVLKNIAFFVLIRSIFITMTHIGPFPDHLIITDTIDVMSAFFITYTIYNISKYLFKSDEKIFNEGL